MTTNHFAVNLVTKGLLNISNITKGMIVLGYKITPVIKKKGGSSARPGLYYPEEPIYKEPQEFYEDIKKTEDIDYIEVRIDWNKKLTNKEKKIEVQLIKKHIEASIYTETGKIINVEIIN